jgi:hypothetical protein
LCVLRVRIELTFHQVVVALLLCAFVLSVFPMIFCLCVVA